MSNVVVEECELSKKDRARLTRQTPCVVWFTGLSASGKTTIANGLESELHRRGLNTCLLDAGKIRCGLNKDLGFSDDDRAENIRRVGEVAKLFVEAGIIVLTSLISPFSAERNKVRDLLDEREFIEVYVNTPIDVCETRDSKGGYEKARQGEIKDFTGVDSSYEVPVRADVTVDASVLSVEASVAEIVRYLEANGYI